MISRRRMGRLITIFSVSNYHAFDGLGINDVTKIRKSEDILFARECGLQTIHLDLLDAPLRGVAPFDLSNALQTSALIAAALLPYLLDKTGFSEGERAKLFVPCGIGGHVDHVAVAIFAAQHFDSLTALYDICFYEDLHYASQPGPRQRGLQRLLALFPEHKFQRVILGVGDRATRKLQLISIYRSQFSELPTDLDGFVPAPPPKGPKLPPHEALLIPLGTSTTGSTG